MLEPSQRVAVFKSSLGSPKFIFPLVSLKRIRLLHCLFNDILCACKYALLRADLVDREAKLPRLLEDSYLTLVSACISLYLLPSSESDEADFGVDRF